MLLWLIQTQDGIILIPQKTTVFDKVAQCRFKIISNLLLQ